MMHSYLTGSRDFRRSSLYVFLAGGLALLMLALSAISGVTVGRAQPADATIYVSTSTNGNVDGLSYADEDILAFDGTTSTWSLYFDGSDVGLANRDLNAFHLLGTGELLMSFRTPVNLPGLGHVDDSDIVKFTPLSLGTNTAGTFELYFDGSDVGLSWGTEDIDAISITPDNRLIVSTAGLFGVPGSSGNIWGRNEDLLVFNAASFGTNTSGNFDLYFDGSDVGLSFPLENVWGAWVDGVSGDIYLSTWGYFSVSGVSGDGADIFVCTPVSTGVDTICDFSSFFDGSEHGLAGQRIDGIFVTKNVQSNQPPVAQDDAFTTDEDTALSGVNVLDDNGNGIDSDPDNDPLNVTEINGASFTSGIPFALPSGAMLTMASGGGFTYDPNGQFETLNDGDETTDSYSYTIDDANGGTATATVIVTVTGVTDPTDDPPTVSSITPVNGATDVPVNANILVSFSENVSTLAGWFSISCSSSGTHDATVFGSSPSFTINPDVDFANGESCTVTLHADLISDTDTDDPPDTLDDDSDPTTNDDFSISFTTVAAP